MERRASLLLLALFAIGGRANAAGDLHSDSLAAKEIFAAVKVGMRPGSVRDDGNRITRLTIYYQGGEGSIPPALGQLDGLRVLRINISGITALPKEIGNLKLLDTIDIGATFIGPSLPQEIGDLPNLKVLKVHTSRLTSLPQSLLNLKGIQVLDFQSNRICKVEDSLKNWILAVSSRALDGQNTTGCNPVPIRLGHAGKAGYPGIILSSRIDGRRVLTTIRDTPKFGVRSP